MNYFSNLGNFYHMDSFGCPFCEFHRRKYILPRYGSYGDRLIVFHSSWKYTRNYIRIIIRIIYLFFLRIFNHLFLREDILAFRNHFARPAFRTIYARATIWKKVSLTNREIWIRNQVRDENVFLWANLTVIKFKDSIMFPYWIFNYII